MFREINMVEVREVLRLRQQGRFQREISRLVSRPLWAENRVAGVGRKGLKSGQHGAKEDEDQPGQGGFCRRGGDYEVLLDGPGVQACRRVGADRFTVNCATVISRSGA